MEAVSVHIAVLGVSADPARADREIANAVIERATAAGHQIVDQEAVADSESAIRDQLVRWIADPEVDVVVVTGESERATLALGPLIMETLPGFTDLFRWLAFQEIGASAMQSNAEAVRCESTFLFVLPAHAGAVRAAMDKLILPQLDSRTKPKNLVTAMPRLRDAVPVPVRKEKTAGGSGLAPKQPAAAPQPVAPAAPAAPIVARGKPPTGKNVIRKHDADPPTRPIDVARLERQIALSHAHSPNDAVTKEVDLAKILPRVPPGADDNILDEGWLDAEPEPEPTSVTPMRTVTTKTQAPPVQLRGPAGAIPSVTSRQSSPSAPPPARSAPRQSSPPPPPPRAKSNSAIGRQKVAEPPPPEEPRTTAWSSFVREAGPPASPTKAEPEQPTSTWGSRARSITEDRPQGSRGAGARPDVSEERTSTWRTTSPAADERPTGTWGSRGSAKAGSTSTSEEQPTTSWPSRSKSGSASPEKPIATANPAVSTRRSAPAIDHSAADRSVTTSADSTPSRPSAPSIAQATPTRPSASAMAGPEPDRSATRDSDSSQPAIAAVPPTEPVAETPSVAEPSGSNGATAAATVPSSSNGAALRAAKPAFDHVDLNALAGSAPQQAETTYPTKIRKSGLGLKLLLLAVVAGLGFAAVVYFFPSESDESSAAQATPPARPPAPKPAVVAAVAIDAAPVVEPTPAPPVVIDAAVEEPAKPAKVAVAAKTPPSPPAKTPPSPPAKTPPSPPAKTPPAEQGSDSKPAANNPTGDPECDEVQCVMSKYDRPCCERYRPREASAKPGIPEELDKAMVKAGVETIKPRIIACGEKSDVKGTVKVNVTVSDAGVVREAEVTETPDQSLGECVSAAIKKAKFGKTMNGGQFTYPFVF